MWMFGFSTNNARSIWIAAAIVGVVLVAILLRRFFMDNTQPRSKRDVVCPNQQHHVYCGSSYLTTIRTFTEEELRSATGDFRIRIGVGATSFVYLAELHDRRFAAIKRLFQDNNNNNNSMLFLNELSVLLRISHPNLVALLGFCFHKGEQLLVLEYVPNKSLFDRMHTHRGQSSGILSWRNRLSIALDIAKALYYLHYVANPPVIHRDIKSSNILLIDDNNAKLADFGLCKLGHHHLDTTTTTNSPSPKQGPSSSSVKGSYGYIDTHYLMTGLVSHKSDVYSFGVVLMELVTGLSSTQSGSATLAEMTEEWRRRIDDMNDQELVGTLLDPKLKGKVANIEEVRMLIKVANLALLPTPEVRPDMSYILRTISTCMHSQNHLHLQV